MIENMVEESIKYLNLLQFKITYFSKKFENDKNKWIYNKFINHYFYNSIYINLKLIIS